MMIPLQSAMGASLVLLRTRRCPLPRSWAVTMPRSRCWPRRWSSTRACLLSELLDSTRIDAPLLYSSCLLPCRVWLVHLDNLRVSFAHGP